MTALWTASQVEEALKAHVFSKSASDSVPFTGVSIDSRTLEEGNLFFAIQGESLDGHDYIEAAFDAGAAAAVIGKSYLPRFTQLNKPLFVVEDTLCALENLGKAAREQSTATIIGITGSVGKTSVREALAFLLSQQAITSASEKSYNNHWGVPLSLVRMDPEARYGVYEMGMNAAGEIAALTQQVRPHIALVTAIAEAHLGPLGSIDAICDAKAEIFEGFDSGQAVAVLNAHQPYWERLAVKAKAHGAQQIILFGRTPQADVTLIDVQHVAEGRRVTASVFGRKITYTLVPLGEHWIDNSLSVLAALYAAGADLDKACEDFIKVRPVPGRGRLLNVSLSNHRNITLLDDGYNANPTSMKAGIKTLGSLQPGKAGRRIAVIGDMLELGPTSEMLHRGLASVLFEQNIDKVFACGAMMKCLYDDLPPSLQGAWAPTSVELSHKVCASLNDGDVIMIKGSLGSGMKVIFEDVLSDQEFAASDGGR